MNSYYIVPTNFKDKMAFLIQDKENITQALFVWYYTGFRFKFLSDDKLSELARTNAENDLRIPVEAFEGVTFGDVYPKQVRIHGNLYLGGKEDCERVKKRLKESYDLAHSLSINELINYNLTKLKTIRDNYYPEIITKKHSLDICNEFLIYSTNKSFSLDDCLLKLNNAWEKLQKKYSESAIKLSSIYSPLIDAILRKQCGIENDSMDEEANFEELEGEWDADDLLLINTESQKRFTEELAHSLVSNDELLNEILTKRDEDLTKLGIKYLSILKKELDN